MSCKSIGNTLELHAFYSRLYIAFSCAIELFFIEPLYLAPTHQCTIEKCLVIKSPVEILFPKENFFKTFFLYQVLFTHLEKISIMI